MPVLDPLRVLALTLAALTLPAGATAQLALVAGAAASVPLGAYGDVAQLGAQGQLGVTLGGGEGLRLAAHGFYDRNPHRIPDDHSVVYGMNVLAGYSFVGAYALQFTPWGGVGGAVHARRSDLYPGLNASRRGLAVAVGTTVARRMGRVSPFLSAFYERGLGGLHSEGYPTGWMTVGAGVEIPLRN